MKPLLSKIILALIFCNSIVATYAQESSKETLFEAIKSNDTTQIKAIIESDSSYINSSVYFDGFLTGVTKYPIHQALRYSSQKTIELLLGSGADPTKQEYHSAILKGKGISSLEILTQYRNLDMLKTFIFRINVDAESYTKSLRIAAESNKRDKVMYLLSVGEKILLKGSE